MALGGCGSVRAAGLDQAMGVSNRCTVVMGSQARAERRRLRPLHAAARLWALPLGAPLHVLQAGWKWTELRCRRQLNAGPSARGL
jgi:hypothetical protein